MLTAFLVITGLGATKGWEVVLQYALLQNLVPGREYALFSVAWTLSIEILFYLAVPVLAVAIRARYKRVSPEWLAGAILVSWVASALFATVLGLAFEGKEAVWGRVVFPSTWQMFCPGLLVALAPHLTAPGWRRWLVDFPRRRAATILMVVLLVVAAVLSPTVPLRYGVHAFALAINLLRIPWAIGLGLLLALAMRARPVRDRRAGAEATVSYGIYLIHPVVMEVLERTWIPFPEEGLGPYVVHLALLVGITVALALLSWRYLEEPLIPLVAPEARRSGSGSTQPVGVPRVGCRQALVKSAARLPVQLFLDGGRVEELAVDLTVGRPLALDIRIHVCARGLAEPPHDLEDGQRAPQPAFHARPLMAGSSSEAATAR